MGLLFGSRQDNIRNDKGEAESFRLYFFQLLYQGELSSNWESRTHIDEGIEAAREYLMKEYLSELKYFKFCASIY